MCSRVGGNNPSPLPNLATEPLPGSLHRLSRAHVDPHQGSTEAPPAGCLQQPLNNGAADPNERMPDLSIGAYAQAAAEMQAPTQHLQGKQSAEQILKCRAATHLAEHWIFLTHWSAVGI